VPQLLGVLLLGQVLVAHPAAEVADVPVAGLILEDLRGATSGEELLVEGVGDDLADRLGDRPVFEDLFGVEVEPFPAVEPTVVHDFASSACHHTHAMGRVDTDPLLLGQPTSFAC
jgi:hypothetical protein